MEKNIADFELYSIDTDGNVYSNKFKKRIKLKPQRASQSVKGYHQVRLFNKTTLNDKGMNVGKLFYVHRLVWETFKGEISKNEEIDHIDADTTNNNLSNLQTVTRRENVSKSTIRRFGKDLRLHRDEIIKDYEELGTYKKVAEKWGCHKAAIYRTIKDVYHDWDKKTNSWKTYRLNPSIKDKWTSMDNRYKNGKNFSK